MDFTQFQPNPNDFFNPVLLAGTLRIDNNAVHLMPYLGVYRTLGTSSWLQAFTQVDTPTAGNNVRFNGLFVGRLNEQTLLYSDVSFGKWWYRDSRGGVTGIASVLELHYTTSLNDADNLLILGTATGADNRFDVLNLTTGLQVEFNNRWRINLAGVFPLKSGRYDAVGGRREDRFFDGEFSLHLNRLF